MAVGTYIIYLYIYTYTHQIRVCMCEAGIVEVYKVRGWRGVEIMVKNTLGPDE